MTRYQKKKVKISRILEEFLINKKKKEKPEKQNINQFNFDE